ncbi:MAG: histidine kinase [Chitinophagaceae bacterium]
MKAPGLLEYALLISCSLLFAGLGLYLLARFNNLFRGFIRNGLLRKNISAFLIIICMSAAMSPLSGGFFYLLDRYGWGWVIVGHLISAAASTLLIYNPARLAAENKQLKQLSFINHNIIIVLVLIIMTLAVNIPLSYMIYQEDWEKARKYVITNSIYIAAATGFVYVVISYLNQERKRKFDAKELELSRLRELKTKAELEALHSKINPHFLYNALNSIADLSVTDGRKARKMTVALADLFRYSINYSDHNFSTVEEELAMAEVYLQIEKIRFEDQLSYSIRLDEEVKHYLIPRFLIQPIVENAVKHGLKATGKMTEILLEVKADGGGLVINIADNGPGFPEELVPGYGVKSVFDKLDLLFPDSYSIQFSNEPRKQVTVHINKLIKNEPVIQSFGD